MNKLILLLFSAILSILAIYAHNYNIIKLNNNNKLHYAISPDTTIFAFDLHGVVLKPDYHKISKILWHDFFKKAPPKLWVKPEVWRSIYKLINNTVSSEYIFDRLAKEYSQVIPFKQIFINLISAQNLNQETIKLIKSLKSKGYKIYILSNIWPESLNILYNKFPELKILFDGAYIPDAKNGFIAKPHPSFYEGFKYYLFTKKQTDKQIIFIDNSEKNIKGAQEAGLYAVEFSSVPELVSYLKDKNFEFLNNSSNH